MISNKIILSALNFGQQAGVIREGHLALTKIAGTLSPQLQPLARSAAGGGMNGRLYHFLADKPSEAGGF